jgi:hypothetical protein
MTHVWTPRPERLPSLVESAMASRSENWRLWKEVKDTEEQREKNLRSGRARKPQTKRLVNREQAAELRAAGLSDKAIGQRLGASAETVRLSLMTPEQRAARKGRAHGSRARFAAGCRCQVCVAMQAGADARAVRGTPGAMSHRSGGRR